MPDPAGAAVSVSALTKRYDAVVAVDAVTFSVEPGEIFGLLGPNGAGKTTTLECLLGLRRPEAGRITVDGLDVIANPGAAKRRIGAQLQSAALQEKISPREAICLFQSFHGRTPAPAALLERFGLTACAEAAFGTLSGGQRQRLFLALAFVNEPSLLVLDEPTAGLDPAARRELHAVMVALRAAGRTVLLSTHDLEEAGQLCDRIGIIDEGRMITVARPADLIAGARGESRVSGVTGRPLPPAGVAALPGVVRVDGARERWQLHTTDVAGTLTALLRLLEHEANPLLDLHVQRPSLEDVFIELTGRPWTREAEERR